MLEAAANAFRTSYTENSRLFVKEEGVRNSAVNSTRIPISFKDLLTDSFFTAFGWHTNSGLKPHAFFYLEGFDAMMGVVKQDLPNHLKTQKFIDLPEAGNIVEVIREWEDESGTTLSHRISINFVKALEEKGLVRFYVGLRTIIAFHLAMISLRPDLNEFFAFDYMRLRPVVYNIHNFSPDKLRKLRELLPNFDELAASFCQQESGAFLNDISKGYTVTYKTALRLTCLINAVCNDTQIPELKELGDEQVTWIPQKREIANVKPSENEVLFVLA